MTTQQQQQQQSKPHEDESIVQFVVEEEEVYKKEGTKYDSKKFHKTKLVTGEMGKKFDRDIFLILHGRDTVFYILFVICVTVVALGLLDHRMFFMAQSLRNHLKEQAGYPSPTLGNTSEGKFEDLSTVSDMWDFIENHLIQYIHTSRPPDPGEEPSPSEDTTHSEEEIISLPTISARKAAFAREGTPSDNETEVNETISIGGELAVSSVKDRGLGYENILIGRPVIRAVMVEEIDCPKPFPAIFIKCYPPYSRSTRKQNIHEDKYGYSAASDTYAESFTGRVAHYYGDGYQEKLGPTYQDSKNTVERLQAERYIGKGTRAVFVDVTYYNPSVNLFCTVKFLFELPPGGGVVPTAYFYSLKLTRATTTGDYIIFGFEILFVVFIVFFVLQDIRSVVFLKLQYFYSFWCWVSMLIVASSIAYFTLCLVQSQEINNVMRLMRKDINDYISFQTITKQELMRRNVLAVIVFFVYLKMFKYMSFNWTMTVLNKTMTTCLNDVFAFVFMFLVMFIGFALFGARCFGTQISHFSSVGLAMFALLRAMLGDFPYTELLSADKFIAPFFYLFFIFLVFFILLNIFLAIVNDTYSDAKTELAIAVPEKRVSDYWSSGLYNVMRECGCKACAPKALVSASHINPSAEEIRVALRRCGYSDLDIDLFLGRYNIDPEAQVRVKDVSKIIEQIRFDGPKRYRPKIKEDTDLNPPAIIALEDFAQQQERLKNVEVAMKVLSEKLDHLLEQLELDGRKKSSITAVKKI